MDKVSMETDARLTIVLTLSIIINLVFVCIKNMGTEKTCGTRLLSIDLWQIQNIWHFIPFHRFYFFKMVFAFKFYLASIN